MNKISLADLRKAVKVLQSADMRPRCNDHDPKAIFLHDGVGTIVKVYCETCGLVSWVHPDYYDSLPPSVLP